MKRLLWASVCAFMFTVMFSTTAFGAFAIQLQSGAGVLYVQDNLAGDTNLAAGQIVFSAGAFNGWTVTVVSGGSNSPNCSGANVVGCLGDTAITANTTGAGTLTILVGDTGYNPVPGFDVSFAVPFQIGTGSTAAQTAYNFNSAVQVDPNGNNLPFGPADTAFTPDGAFNVSGTIVSTPPGIVAMTTTMAGGLDGLQIATVLTTTAAGGNFQIQGNILAVPEPTSMMLFGTVLLATGIGLRRKFIRS